jgi:hypothetical protein
MRQRRRNGLEIFSLSLIKRRLPARHARNDAAGKFKVTGHPERRTQYGISRVSYACKEF